MPLIRDPGQRAGAVPEGRAAARRPAAGAGQDGRRRARRSRGRYVRIELPGKQRTLTLAEVEVYSDGRNVARKGKATQKQHRPRRRRQPRPSTATRAAPTATAARRTPRRATDDPWWEVDLGREFPIEPIVVCNRTDGNLGNRLNNFTLKVLDARPQVGLPEGEEPDPEGEGRVRRSAASRRSGSSARRRCSALTSVRGKEADDVQGASRSSSTDDADRAAAVQALLRIPRSDWPKDEAKPLLDDADRRTSASCRSAERTTPAALDALQLGRGAGRRCCPPDEAEGRPQGTRRDRRARHPRRHADRPDDLRQGAARRAGRQAGRVRVREHRHHAAQLRDRPARLAGGGRQRWPRRTATAAGRRWSGSTSRRRTKVLLASRLLQPRRVAAAAASPPRRSRASTRTSAPTPATGGGCTGPCTSSPTSTSTWPTRRPTSPRTRCRSRTSC